MPINEDDTLTGTLFDDVLNGGAGDDIIDGGVGDDHLIGGSGEDTLAGGAGDDTVSGGSGDDVLIFNVSDNIGYTNIYDGGSGVDSIEFQLTFAQSTNAEFLSEYQAYLAFIADETLPSGQASNDTFTFTSLGMNLTVSKIEHVTLDVEAPLHIDTPAANGFTEGDDVFPVTGNWVVTQYFEGSGGRSFRILFAGGGNDEIYLNGYPSPPSGPDIYWSRVDLGAGDDTFTAETVGGSFWLSGGSGSDEFVFLKSSKPDWSRYFEIDDFDIEEDSLVITTNTTLGDLNISSYDGGLLITPDDQLLSIYLEGVGVEDFNDINLTLVPFDL